MRKGSKASPETRRKMTESQLRRWAQNRDAYLQVCVYEPHLGAKRSDETRAKMSATHRELYAQHPEIVRHRIERLKRLWSRPGYALKWAARKNSLVADDAGKLYLNAESAALKLGVSRQTVLRYLDTGTPVAGRILSRVITEPEAL